MNFDATTYDKAAKHAPGHGYEARNAAPISIVVHSTSNPNAKNTPFKSEATFLLDARLVSAHYLIGKDGKGARFLEPRAWAAWHAGTAQKSYLNQRSIGIELHHSVGDPPYPKAQMDALADLLSALSEEFNIPFGMMETHGQIAIAGPYKRKTDPSDMSYAAFVAWRAQLTVPAPTFFYRVSGLPVYQRADHTGPLWGHLVTGEHVAVDDMGNGHLADSRGFVDVNGLEVL